MEQKKDKPHVNLGTIGHVDHGKTTLTAAITYVMSLIYKQYVRNTARRYDQIDNAKEEKERGITINATTVVYETDMYIYIHTDCPGHKDFRDKMMTGTGSGLLDFQILLVAINDSVTSHTVEFIKLCVERGFPNFAVFINKTDLYSKEEVNDYVELVLAEVTDVLEKVGGKMIAWTASSAQQALNPTQTPETIEAQGKILQFFKDIEAVLPTPKREIDKPFLMQVENLFEIEGRGLVVAGPVQKGTLTVGQSLEVLHVKNYIPGKQNLVCVVTSMEAFKRQQQSTQAGDNVGLLLRGIKRENIEGGDILTIPGTFKMHRTVKIDMRICTKDEGGRQTSIKSGFRPVFFIGASKYTGTLYLTKITDQNGAVIAESENEMQQVQENAPDLKMIAHPGYNAEAMIVFDHYVPIVSKKLQIMEGAERVASALVMKFVEPATE